MSGTLPPAPAYLEVLAEAGERRDDAGFSLAHARMRARHGDVVGTVGQAAKAVVEAAHALRCRRRQWALNEKQLVERAGLGWLRAAMGPAS